jgi:FUS-interacting serine-arginine-rich protein 1
VREAFPPPHPGPRDYPPRPRFGYAPLPPPHLHDEYRHRYGAFQPYPPPPNNYRGDFGMPPPHGDPYFRGGPPPPNHNQRGGRRDEGPPGVSLLIRNIAPDVTNQDLQAAFGRIGEIRDVYIPRDFHSQQPKGFAFIEYANAATAFEARDEMNCFVLKGRELEVVFAQEKRKTPNEMRGRVGNEQGSPDRDAERPAARSSSFDRAKNKPRP